MRTAPLEGGPECAAIDGGFAFRKRLDGGYTIAGGFNTVHEIVPDSFRFFFDFLPALRAEFGTLKLRLGERFAAEWKTKRRWPLDGESPFEKTRMLDPEPLSLDQHRGAEAARAGFPGLRAKRRLRSNGPG